jgi:hypothetical protein
VGCSQRRRGFGRADLVAERQGTARAQAQQGACRDHTDRPAIGLDRHQMANAQPLQAADRGVEEGVGGHRRHRTRHARADRDGKRRRAAFGNGGHQVALGQDAGRPAAAIEHHHGADARIAHAARRLLQGGVGGDVDERAQQVAYAMAVGETVDPLDRRLVHAQCPWARR